MADDELTINPPTLNASSSSGLEESRKKLTAKFTVNNECGYIHLLGGMLKTRLVVGLDDKTVGHGVTTTVSNWFLWESL